MLVAVQGAHVLFISELTLPSGKRIEYAGVDGQGFPLVRVAPGVMNGELSEWIDNNAVRLPARSHIIVMRMHSPVGSRQSRYSGVQKNALGRHCS